MTTDPNHPPAQRTLVGGPLRGYSVEAVMALFRLSLNRYAKSRRLIAICVLMGFPIVVVALTRWFGSPPIHNAARLSQWLQEAELMTIFGLIAHAIVPISALVYVAGLISDEVEEQTLTYLLMRPVPRWTIYVSKFLAAASVTCVAASVFVIATYAALHWNLPTWNDIIPQHVLKSVCLFGLSTLAYCSIFGLIGLLVRKPLVVGAAYIMVFEGVFANIDFVIRRATVMYYFRVLVERWLNLDFPVWSIDLTTAPSSPRCVVVLLMVCLVTTALAATVVAGREFRLKTPQDKQG